jgi:hypothetical protein
MKNLNLKSSALAIFAVFVLCFVFVAARSGRHVADLWSVILISYKTIPLVLLFIGLFVKYLWRMAIFRGWLVPFPDINGTWQGTILTTWTDPKSGTVPGPIPVILTIKQSFTRISCVMRTAEMTSRSFLADFWLDGDEQIRKLGYSYHSQPSILISGRSESHDGTIVFELIGRPVAKLHGTYWTARKTAGEITLAYRQKELLEEFPSDLGEHPVSGNP